MSTCPEKDIHSLYVDGELPGNFIGEYEAHIASCPKCRAELEKVRRIHEALKADAGSLTVDHIFLDKSYERLQSRMRFAKVVKKSQPEKNIVRLWNLVPAAAAAAVFALIVPVRLNSARNSGMHDAQMLSVASKKITPIVNNDVLVDGGIEQVAFRGNDTKPLALKASDFEVLKAGDADSGENDMTISVTELSSLNAISAANVSFSSKRLDAPDFLK